MATIYHNPRCSKSRQTLALLQEKLLLEKGTSPDIVLYLDSPPDQATLKSLLKKLGMAPRELLRKGEDEYKALQLDDPSQSDSSLIAAMCKHPKLIERPIVVNGNRAVIGRPPEAVLEIL